MLTLRQKSIETNHGVFNAVTGVSLLDEADDLCQRMQGAEPEMSDLELHHFKPKSKSEYGQMFHRPMTTALWTQQA